MAMPMKELMRRAECYDDLLEALQTMLDHFDCDWAHEAARAAIVKAKATGEEA